MVAANEGWTFKARGRQLLFSTVRIETTQRDGSPVGSGTGFVFHDSGSDKGHGLFLVSNKHVIQSGWNAYVFFTRESEGGTPIIGEPFYVHIDGFEHQWHGHPRPEVDVAVMPLSWQLDLVAKGNARAFLRPVTVEAVANQEDFANLDVASTVIFIGYPNGMFDQKHYTPIVRQGFHSNAGGSRFRRRVCVSD